MSAEFASADDEVLKRVRRLETRFMKLCTFLGLDPTSGRDKVAVVSVFPLVLDLSGLDVSLGDLLDACRKSGIKGTAVLRCKGNDLGTFKIGEK